MVESLRVLNKVTGEESDLLFPEFSQLSDRLHRMKNLLMLFSQMRVDLLLPEKIARHQKRESMQQETAGQKKYGQLTTAAADGAVAALAACKYIADVAEK